MKSMHLLFAAVLLTAATVWSSGSGSRYRAGAYIYRGRVLPEGSKIEEKIFTEYRELCFTG